MILILCVVIASVVSVHFNHNAAANKFAYFGYCATTPDQSPVYFSEVFSTGLNPNYAPDTTDIGNDFNEYLKGRFDFKSNANYAVACLLNNSMGQSQSDKRNYEAQMRQANKQVIEVEWGYTPGAGSMTTPRPGTARPIINTDPVDHTFCFSDAYQQTVYFTGPQATPPPVTMYSWINGFTQFLKGEYSFQGRVYCNMSTAQLGQRLVKAHLDGARAAGKKVVDELRKSIVN